MARTRRIPPGQGASPTWSYRRCKRKAKTSPFVYHIMSPSEPAPVVCLAAERWNDEQHGPATRTMLAMAETRHVFYVNFGSHGLSGIVTRELLPTPSLLLSHPERLVTRPREHQVGNLTVLQFYTPSSVERVRVGHPLRSFGLYGLRLLLLERHLRREALSNALLWIMHPGYGAAVSRLPHSLLVYDCLEEFAELPRFKRGRAWISEQERQLCASADFVFCATPGLLATKQNLGPAPTLLAPVPEEGSHRPRVDAMLEHIAAHLEDRGKAHDTQAGFGS